MLACSDLLVLIQALSSGFRKYAKLYFSDQQQCEIETAVHSPSLTFFLVREPLSPNLLLPHFLEDPTELGFIEAPLFTSIISLFVESASADWMKLDMLWIGPLTDVPLSVDAVFDVLGWSVFLDFFFL